MGHAHIVSVGKDDVNCKRRLGKTARQTLYLELRLNAEVRKQEAVHP